jgi:hypothetical protein
MIAEPAHLEQMLGRLKLTAIRDQLDSLLDEAAKGELTLRETLTLFCEREIARKDERRIEMAMSIAKFPYVRGTYFYADYCTAFVRSFRLVSGQATDARDWTAQLSRGLNRPTAFGTDADGEVYLVDHDGEVYKIVPAS